MIIKRKQIILCLLVAMVGVAGYLNYAYKHNENAAQVSVPVAQETAEKRQIGESQMVALPDETEATVEVDAKTATIKAARQAKELSRSKAMELLKATMDDEGASQDAKNQATAQYNAMADSMEKEGIIEGILKTKGIKDCVVFINDGNVTAAVESVEPLDQATIAKIQDAITTTTKLGADKIKITEVK